MAMSYLSLTAKSRLSFASSAYGGWGTWPNLVKGKTLSGITPNTIIFDTVVDWGATPAYANAYIEGYIRRLWNDLPNVRLIFMNFFVIEDKDIDDPTALDQDMIDRMKAICDQYGIPIVDYQAEITRRVLVGGEHLVTYFLDTVHPTIAGHEIALELLKPHLLTGAGRPDPMPARLYEASADFENDPLVKYGTDDDARTGTWVDTGTSTASVTPGSTIAYSGTFRSFGCYNAAGSYPDVNVSVDGVPIIPTAYFDPNGWDFGTRALHTVEITVLTTCQIDEFWAI